jgi:hypothetical protein
MRKVLLGLVFCMLLMPAVLSAQGTLRVSSLYGPVEWRAVSSASFSPLTASTQTVRIGDELRTGSGGTVMLELPDGSYMVVSENTTLTIQDYWSGNLRSLVNVVVGKVRFYIQRLGGRPNPYRVTTPTALIAVRGTTFDVSMDESLVAEIRCLDGSVTVESVGLSDREVILESGRKTLVRPGEYPLTPVANDQALETNRVIRIVKKSAPAVNSKDTPSIDVLVRDNDRNNRASDPLRGPASRSSDRTDRAKPTLNY